MKYGLYLILWSMMVSGSCYAQTFTGTGTINQLRMQSPEIIGADTSFLILNGFFEAGECKTYSGGYVLMRILDSDERIFSTALAAQMAEKEVVVSVDDQIIDSRGCCILRWIHLK